MTSLVDRRTAPRAATAIWSISSAALVVLTAIASATSAVVVGAPYRGAVGSVLEDTYRTGCATAGIPSPSNGSAKNGTFTTMVDATARNCARSLAGVGDNNEAYASAEFDLAVPIPINTSASHSLVVTWSIHATTEEAIVPGNCTAPRSNVSYWWCSVEAGWTVFGVGNLLDTTNGTSFVGSGWLQEQYSFNATYDYYGTLYHSAIAPGNAHGGNFSSFINTTTLNRAHHYVLFTSVYVTAYTSLYTIATTFVGCHASAAFGLSGGANKALLQSIVVT